MKVYVDISPFWPKKEDGSPKTVHAVFIELSATPYRLHRNTLKLALEGKLDRGSVTNLVKLAQAASHWTNSDVRVDDLLRIEE